MKDFRPLLFQWQKEITNYLTKYLPIEEIPRHLDVIATGTLGESRQTILADHPPAVHDGLIALSRVLNLFEAADFAANHPDHPTTQARALTAAVMALLAGFNLARALDEDLAQPLIRYSLKFMDAGKQQRDTTDALDEVLDNIVDEHVKTRGKLPNWRQVVRCLENYAEQRHPVIQEVEIDNEDEGRVFWKGSDTPTSFKRVRERLTLIRKKHSNDNKIFPTTG